MKLRSIRKACRITDLIFSEVVKNFLSIRSEFDCATFMRKQMRKHKVKQAFPIIVASGKNAFVLHHKPNKQKLLSRFCVVDFGVRVNGYCSDMTRTLYLGKPRKDEVQRYNLVVGVNERCIKSIKIGKPWKDVDGYARKMFGRYSKKFIHGLGHGLGKKVHDVPRISPRSEGRVQAGQIVTIEPGLYVKGKYGIRIEDDVLVTKNKVEVLTKSTKRLIVIK